MPTTPVSSCPLRILLVDDEELVVRLTTRMLEQAGHSIAGVTHAAAALERAEREEFDLVITDLAMPGLDGLELLRRIRALRPGTRFILMSGNDLPHEAVRRALEVGLARLLSKPFSFDDLLGAVEAVARDGVATARAFGLALEQTYLVFQPVVSFSQQRVVAYEALVRSSFPQLLSPVALLEAAERCGGIDALGRRVRRLAAEAFAQAPQETLLFVNLHPLELGDEELFSPASPLSAIASRVVLEVTERARLESIPGLPQRLRRLRELGFRIAIDDIGAGYSGLSNLVELEPDVVKLDMSLTRGVDSSKTRRSVICALGRMCAEARIAMIAEGVETAAERDALVGLGCDQLQGYFFSRPAPPFVQVDVRAFTAAA